MRAAVTHARARAQAEHSREIREEHLLAGLFTEPRVVTLLAGFHVDESVLHEIRAARRRGGLSTSDAEALAGLGKQALASALRTAQARGDRELRAEHLLLGLLAGRGLVADVLADHGVTAVTVLAAVDDAA